MTTATIIAIMAAQECVLNDSSASERLRVAAAKALDRNMDALIRRAKDGDEMASRYLQSINKLAHDAPHTKFVERRADGTGYNIWNDGVVIGNVADLALAFSLHPDAEYREEGDGLPR